MPLTWRSSGNKVFGPASGLITGVGFFVRRPCAPVIVEQYAGHWTAWQAGSPQVAFGGDTAAVAIDKLCEAAGIDGTQIVADHARCSGDAMELLVGDMDDCRDCGGTGRYVWLNKAEKCQACGGLGVLVRAES